MTAFITTLYNEEHEIISLISHVYDYVDRLILIDDGSTDATGPLIEAWIKAANGGNKVEYHRIEHTGLCELGRIEALKYVSDDEWVIMLDADERFGEGVLEKILDWIQDDPPETHMYFNQVEYIDGKPVRTFQKAKVFRKSCANLPEIIHGDPSFTGDPAGFGWSVIHRKTTTKQIQRETEYLLTYKKLLDEGKIDKGRYEWMKNLHHFVKQI